MSKTDWMRWTPRSSSSWLGPLAGILMVLAMGFTLIVGNDDFIDFKNLHPSQHFAYHQRIRPILWHGKDRLTIPNTRKSNGHHLDDVTLQFDHEDGDITVDLKLAVDLLPEGHFLSYQSPDDGAPVVIQNFTRSTVDHCHYTGSIRGRAGSRAAVSTCRGLTGMLFDGPDVYYIETGESSTSTADDHFFYRHSDRIGVERKCGHESSNETHSTKPAVATDEVVLQHLNRLQRPKRSNVIAGPYNSNPQSSYVELIMVVDRSSFESLGTLKGVHENCKTLANLVNALYMPLNVYVVLTGVVVFSKEDQFEISSNAGTTLSAFTEYRKEKLYRKSDNAILLTRKSGGHNILGLGHVGKICSYAAAVVYEQGTQTRGFVASVIAHEMGHNFGINHDEDIHNCRCHSGHCIMEAYAHMGKMHWSSCSIEKLAQVIDNGLGSCLKNKPSSLFGSPTCGNGFVEKGEQCDCGLAVVCKNPCCEAKSCTFKSNATCATGDCCDLSTCSLRAVGTHCRSAENECDLAEYCTGETEYCPEDLKRQNAVECGNGKAYCYQGQCRSHDDQCRWLWGSSSRSAPNYMYGRNTKGVEGANCGYSFRTSKSARCEAKDTMCGILHCIHANGKFQSVHEAQFKAYETAITINNVKRQPSFAVTVDYGLPADDPGLAPNGARCGDNKMCLNQRCESVVSLRKRGIGRDCPYNCSSHGICDNKGECHCKVGFGPPLCNVPGPGGSIHSRRTTDTNDGIDIVRTIVYVLFLGVIPFISLCVVIVYCVRHNRPQFLRCCPVHEGVPKLFKCFDVQTTPEVVKNPATTTLIKETKGRPMIGPTVLKSSTNPRVWGMIDVGSVDA